MSGNMQHGLQTSQCRLVKKLTERRLNKMADSSIPVSLVFFCLPLLHKFQTHCDSRKEKQFVLSLSERDSVTIQDTSSSVQGKVR